MSENTQVSVVNEADLELLKQFGIVANVSAAERINAVSLKGSKWRYIIDGQESTVQVEVEGEMMAAPSIKAIILNQLPNRSYAMFEGTYVEGENKSPICWSSDGISPDGDVVSPQCAKCATCDKRVVGSAFPTDGTSTRACKESRRIAVAISAEPTHTPLRLQLAVTSLWEDKKAEAANGATGWHAYDAYVKFLASKGIPHTSMVETIMKFDDKVSHPKVLFKMGQRLPDTVLRKVLPLVNSEPVQKVLGLNKQHRIAAPVSEAIQSVTIAAPVIVAPVVSEPAKEVKNKALAMPEESAKVTKPKKEIAVPVVANADSSFDGALSEW